MRVSGTALEDHLAIGSERGNECGKGLLVDAEHTGYVVSQLIAL